MDLFAFVVAFIRDLAIPIATLLATSFGAFVGARWGRNSVFREKLYDRRIEGYIELIEGAGAVRDAVRSLYRIRPNEQVGWDEMREWRLRVIQEDKNFGFTRRKLTLFVSRDVEQKTDEFLIAVYQLLDAVFELFKINDDFILEDKIPRVETIESLYNSLCNTARKSLGTDTLSDEMDHAFGESFSRILPTYTRKSR